MDIILLIGIPASGKSTFYIRNFFSRYMRISLDLYQTRNKEQRFLSLALSLQQRLVIDNTNVTKAERAKYIVEAKQQGYQITGYYFRSDLQSCIARNNDRTGREKIERAGIVAKYSQLELPDLNEGFDKLFYVQMEKNEFEVTDWKNEI